MSRTHEDRERHTTVDHRPGGTRGTLTLGEWCAIDVVHVTAERATAGVAAYETLIEKSRRSGANRHAAAVFTSLDHRRVLAFVGLSGHNAYRHLLSAWDDRHLIAGHRTVAEATTLALYRITDVAGDARIDAASPDSYAFERGTHAIRETRSLAAALQTAAGFRGALVLAADDAIGYAILSRFEHKRDFVAFRAGSLAVEHLGPIGSLGEAEYSLHAIKTYAATA